MNYNRPELIDRLAAEYVLGTLRGKARDRFETLKRNSHGARAAVWRWENRLHGMTSGLREIAPPEHIWHNIGRQIVPQQQGAPVASIHRARFWQGWSAIATAASIVLGILLLSSTPPLAPRADHVAVFMHQATNQQAQPQWLVSVDLHTGKLTARALNIAATKADSDFELWMLPAAGAAPRSLGLLPVAGNRIDRQLPTALAASLRTAAGLAISLEPAGGSHTGLPTGPVLYQAPLLQL